MGDGKKISLGEGAGGELMQKMLKELVLPLVRRTNVPADPTGLPPELLDDSAAVDDMAITIDGHTVWPLEFPGGDIGSLSVYGTVNDLWVVGARPKALALSMVIEEGLDRSLLSRISSSIGSASELASVQIATGDTKVVERGGVKGMVITTAGIGQRHSLLEDNHRRATLLREKRGVERPMSSWLRDDGIREGDVIILSGSVGDHGISLLSFREGYGFETELGSDLACVGEVIESSLKVGGVIAAKDLTRGGLSNGLNEWCGKSGCSIEVREMDIPVKPAVISACDMLGLDPYEIGNEGKVILGVAPGSEEEILKAVKGTPIGREASIIGRVGVKGRRVVLETEVGGKRIMDPPYGDPVPRIC
ncbi:MAG: hydrogenase expression/formation protein HypE [Candidatus Thermoplasmatota archaeon]|nr:hydrogenase expression/formation protein HypE [Candidatus Thermoplasmatota archaeon]